MNQWQGHRHFLNLINACGEWRLACLETYSNVAQIAKTVNAVSDKKESEHTKHHCLLCIELRKLQSYQSDHADPSTPQKSPTMDIYCKHQNWTISAMEKGGLVWWITFCFTTCGWPSVWQVCHLSGEEIIPETLGPAFMWMLLWHCAQGVDQASEHDIFTDLVKCYKVFYINLVKNT